MTTTDQDIQALTPQHRIVWHSPPGQPVEMGLCVSEGGSLFTDAGHLVRYADGHVVPSVPCRIIRIIPPASVPHIGMVIGKTGSPGRRLVCVEEGGWLGYAPEISDDGHWFTDADVPTLIEDHGWEVMGDLSAPGEVTDAEVEAAARVLADHFGLSVGDGWLVWADETHAALEAARAAR